VTESTYFLLNAGLATEKSFDMTMVQSAIGFVGTLISMWSMRRFGRRPLYVVGFAVITTMYFVIGFLGLIPEKTDAQCAVRSLLIVANFVYQSTVGPTAYAIIAEISSNRLRSKVLVCSRIATNCLAILNGYYVPQFINPTALNWGAKAGWYFAGTGALAGLYMFFRLPEPKVSEARRSVATELEC
jgi:SP family general alpha glucoside:H+ symporter-like MFS transporter